MGRRALKKIDPHLDLSRWLLTEEDLPEWIPDESVFGRAAPLEIEVGSGKGMFLAYATQAYHDHDFLGIEIAAKYARFAAAGLARRECPNGRLVEGDGVRLFRERIRGDSVVAVHVYFPDPWWKQRHRKRRVMNEGFLRDVQRVLQPGGTLLFWTDVLDYYETTLKLIGRVTDLQGPTVPAQQAAQHEEPYRTHFERRMRLHDLPIYRSEFRKSQRN